MSSRFRDAGLRAVALPRTVFRASRRACKRAAVGETMAKKMQALLFSTAPAILPIKGYLFGNDAERAISPGRRAAVMSNSETIGQPITVGVIAFAAPRSPCESSTVSTFGR